MTKNTEELKGYFKDGAMPSGENFASLIDSMVHKDEFGKWTERGQVSLGAAESKWQLRVDEDERLVVERSPKDDQPAAESPTPSTVRMAAWVAMQGRIGTHDPTVSESKPKRSGLNTKSMKSVRADGKWHHIADIPDRCYAFEIVAHMSGPQPTAAPGILQTLRRVTGLTRAHSAITHAIVTTSELGSRASIRQTVAPDSSAVWRRPVRWLLGIALLLFLLLVVMLPMSLFPYVTLGEPFFEGYDLKRTAAVDGVAAVIVPILKTYEAVIDYATDEGEAKASKAKASEADANAISYIGGILAVIGLLLALYIVIKVLTTFQIYRTGIRLAWRKSGGSVLRGTAAYALYMRGGHYPEDTSVEVHYHVTQLWG